jgi:DNA-binding transcriptional MocR family regulator
MLRYSAAVLSLRSSEIRDLMGLAVRPDVISFAGGMPGNELFPVQEIDEIYAHLPAETKQTAFQYGPTPGHPPLLESLKEHLRKKGLPVGNNRLLITTGSLQAINIIGKVLLDPGDTVVTENPCFIGAISAFKSYQARLRGVDLDPEGVDVEGLRRAAKSSPKFVYLTPNFHNPAGTLYSEERKKAVAAVLKSADELLVEDDAYGDLYFDEEARRRCRPMKAEYENDLTICYTGSFSKILGPGFRLGWMLVPPEVYQKAELCKQSMDACSPNFTQVLADEFLRSGGIYPYLERLRDIYRQRKDLTVAAMREYLPGEVSWVEPRGGFYIWLKLPRQLDVEAVLRSSIGKGAIFVQGKTFDPEGRDNSHIRLAFSNTPEEKIEQGIKIIGEAMKECMKRNL